MALKSLWRAVQHAGLAQAQLLVFLANARNASAVSILTLNAHSPDETQRLVLAASDGQRDAFDELVRAHMSSAYLVALAIVGRPADAEDVSQADGRGPLPLSGVEPTRSASTRAAPVCTAPPGCAQLERCPTVERRGHPRAIPSGIGGGFSSDLSGNRGDQSQDGERGSTAAHSGAASATRRAAQGQAEAAKTDAAPSLAILMARTGRRASLARAPAWFWAADPGPRGLVQSSSEGRPSPPSGPWLNRSVRAQSCFQPKPLAGQVAHGRLGNHGAHLGYVLVKSQLLLEEARARGFVAQPTRSALRASATLATREASAGASRGMLQSGRLASKPPRVPRALDERYRCALGTGRRSMIVRPTLGLLLSAGRKLLQRRRTSDSPVDALRSQGAAEGARL